MLESWFPHLENTRDQLNEDGHKKALHIKVSKNPHIQLKDTLQNRQSSRYLDGSAALRNYPNQRWTEIAQ